MFSISLFFARSKESITYILCIFGFLEDINLLCERLGALTKCYICTSIKAAQREGASLPAWLKYKAGRNPNCKCHCFNKNNKPHDFIVEK